MLLSICTICYWCPEKALGPSYILWVTYTYPTIVTFLAQIIGRAFGLIDMRKETDTRLIQTDQIVAARCTIFYQTMIQSLAGCHSLSTGGSTFRQRTMGYR